MDAGLWLAPLAGIAVAAACGLRAFLPLLLLGGAARAGIVELHEGARWMSGDLALGALAVATVVEVLGDKVPVVDHALDAVGTVLRPLAASLGAYAALVSWPTPWGQLAALALGAVAVGVHLAKAKVRIGSSALTLGSANPVISLLEDVLSLALVAVAILAPIAVAVVVVALIAVARRPRRPAAAAIPSPGAIPTRPSSPS
jgi:hypothetical protein